jgi:predicted phosphodiesterase
MTRIAVLADVHGNLAALEAVAADVARRGADLVVNLGDHASGPLRPSETVAFLMRRPWTQIAGNCDRAIAHLPPDRQGPSDRFAAERLGAEERAWLAALPSTASVADGEVLLVHGTPSSDATMLLETVEHGRTRLASSAEIAGRLAGAPAPLPPVVLCAHSHLPRVVRLGATLVVNPGSVGLPAYDGDDPAPHVVETGSPDARWALLERRGGEWRAELVAVPYDHRAAAALARAHGRADWETGLRTGWMTT